MQPSAEPKSASPAPRTRFLYLALVPFVMLAGLVFAAAYEAFRAFPVGPFNPFWLVVSALSASLLILLLALYVSEARKPRPAGRTLTTLLIASALVELGLISVVIPLLIVAERDFPRFDTLVVAYATLVTAMGLFVLAAVLVCHDGLRSRTGLFARILGLFTGAWAVFFAPWLLLNLFLGRGVI